ncbi:hypothetical protein [Cellulomonas oligotrophica]|uniref:Uncharacterized protein n=1 Tax=Cellulomonas oligotrophica TaxID=931536 RepID=A0A7Y9FIV8_9CELL|nr:hypothetical protein [Cellulomonas oligotrophica]NYD87807.1 hypothetical protein [Cellulomonas oligotrophica]GIG32988.1 hypothetical protein Col01nite_21470 [Cellulomonas oligotrophica]
MELLPLEAHRTLAYIAAVNRGGAHPSPLAVTEFYESARPKLSTLAAYAAGLAKFDPVGSTEMPIAYFLRMDWIRVDSAGVSLTKTGQALIRALDIKEQDQEVIEVVLDEGDRFAYARAIAFLRTDSPSLLVDPYLRLEQMIDLDRVRAIERVLVGPRLSAEVLADLRNAAEMYKPQRNIEVRQASSLHDRFLIPESGRVLMLGGSLNTFSRAPIAITTLSDQFSDVVRERYEEVWSTAQAAEEPASDPASHAGPADAPTVGA